MRVSDMDQEVKDSAILCCGMLLAKGAFHGAEQSTAIEVLIQRITNEMTRLSAVKSLQTAMGNAEIAPLISNMIAAEMPVVASFLRKNQRQLRVTTLNLLANLIQNGLRVMDEVMAELPQLINDQDLHVAQLG